jgi:hypothetical protein
MSRENVDVESFWKRRWRLEPTWTARELAQLCCGWSPETGWYPHCEWADGLPETDESIARQALYGSAWDAIQRALRLGDLRPVSLPDDPSPEAFYYGDAPVFRSDDAAKWAAARFPDFALRPGTLGPVTAGSLGATSEPHIQITVDQAESVDAAPYSWRSEAADESSRRDGRRAQVDAFIARVHQEQNRRDRNFKGPSRSVLAASRVAANGGYETKRVVTADSNFAVTITVV